MEYIIYALVFAFWFSMSGVFVHAVAFVYSTGPGGHKYAPEEFPALYRNTAFWCIGYLTFSMASAGLINSELEFTGSAYAKVIGLYFGLWACVLYLEVRTLSLDQLAPTPTS